MPWGRRLLVVAGLLLVTSAHADWATRTVNGGPARNVHAWGSHLYSVSTDGGARLEEADGGVRFIPIDAGLPGSAATYRAPSGCFMSFQVNNTVAGVQGCAVPGAVFPSNASVAQVRFTESGAGFATGLNESQLDTEVVFTSPEQGGFQRRPWLTTGPFPVVSGVPTPALGVIDLGTNAHALVATNQLNQAGLHWFRDRDLQASYVLPEPAGVVRGVNAIDLVPSGGSTPLALFGGSSGLYRGPLNTSPNPFTQVPLPGGPGRVTGVDLNPDAGSPYGDGFGMAVVQRDGGAVLLSAVPALQPGAVGTEWRVNPKFPTSGLTAREVSCHGARFCVLTLDKSGPDNLLLYTNAAPPTLTLEPDLTVREGTSRTIPIRAEDPDGDAVRVTVTPSDVNTPALTMSTTAADGGVDLQLTAGAVCADVEQKLRVAASDGLAEHDQVRDVSVWVVHTRAPAAPQLSTPHLLVQAGQGAATLSVVPEQNPVCAIAGYDWMAVTQGAPRLGPGQSVDFPTPPFLCNRNGVSHVYRVRAVDTSGLASAPTDVVVQVRPWGTPSAAFAPDAGVAITARQSAQLVPQAVHPCVDEVASQDFPGVDTTWTLVEGRLPAEGVRLLADDGGLITQLPAITSRIDVETEECGDARLAFAVRHVVRDGSGLGGPDAGVRLTVDPQWVPATQGELRLSRLTSTALQVAGEAQVSGLNCLEQRGGVRARFELTREDGTLVESREFTAPGPWSFELTDNCRGGNYYVSGSVLGNVNEPSGASVGRSEVSGQLAEPTLVVVPPVELELRPLHAPQLTASCGEAARGVLQQLIPEGPCSTVDVTWQQTGGPALTEPFLRGRRIEVATQETDFGALIGRSVELLVTADTGKVSQRTHVVPITTEPFVEVSRRTERPSGSETSLVGVSVELRNTTACGVSEVQHVEHLEGLDYVPGSASFNGAPVESELEGDTLTVRGLVLEGNATGMLTYVVRPRLLGQMRFEGQSSLRGVPISAQPQGELPTGGCGCSGGGSGAAVFGLAGLLAVLRRRSRR